MDTLDQLIPVLTGVGSFLITYIVMPVIIDVSHLKHLCDDADGGRKVHHKATPNLGGVGIFAGVFIAFAVSGYALQSWVPYLAAGITILFFSGIKDDILVISPIKKLLLQLTAITVLIWGAGLVITDLGGVFGLQSIPLWAGAVLTFFTIVVVVNAYNLIDGIDGLAGGIGVIASAFFAWWFWQAGMMTHSVLAITLTGSLLAFLSFNFQPASIFMGDTGSQIVGYLLAFFAVSFVNAGLAGETASIPFAETIPVMVLSVLIVPLYDTLRVFLVRAFNGHSPFQPDRRHVHHQLLDMGLSHRICCYLIYSFNLAIIGLTMLLAGTEINLLFGIVLLTTMILFPTVRIKRRLLAKLGIPVPKKPYLKLIQWDNGIHQNMVAKQKEGDDDYKEIAV
ncbi:MAG TPA: MraY family glycosyltransferase [Balneolaceae bacterium]|nr:MraY family glycosyltransferase [Balneolaceae bacterium]